MSALTRLPARDTLYVQKQAQSAILNGCSGKEYLAMINSTKEQTIDRGEEIFASLIKHIPRINQNINWIRDSRIRDVMINYFIWLSFQGSNDPSAKESTFRFFVEDWILCHPEARIEYGHLVMHGNGEAFATLINEVSDSIVKDIYRMVEERG